MRIYGIAAAQNSDNSGETILIDNIDTSKMRILNDEHGESAYSMIGAVEFHKKIHSLQECADDYERRCWDHAKVPFLYVRGELADMTEHPNAKAAAALLEFCTARPDLPLRVGLSIEGGILERSGEDNKTLSKTLATGASFTIKPCNPRCALFMEGDLRKSIANMAPPPEYIEALKKSDSTTSFKENRLAVLMVCMEMLEKSTRDYFGAFTSIKCHHCGTGIRFFKSSRDTPNRCHSCSEPFSLAAIWSAIQKD